VKSFRKLPATCCQPDAIGVTEGAFDFTAILSFMLSIHQSSDIHSED
jgi:hypothetical protein